jgi:asparagine synthase (glutamine-hydrolysing)
MESLFTQQQIAELLIARTFDSPPRVDPGFDPMQSLRLADLQHYLPDDLLLKVDTASMAVALEVRAPFLDRDLVRAVIAAPTWQLVPDGKRKGLLRAIAKKHLPAEIVDRPKQGFTIPFGEWLIRDFGGLRALLLDRLHRRDPFGPIHLNSNAVRRLVNEHLQGECDHTHRLFALLTLSIWADTL